MDKKDEALKLALELAESARVWRTVELHKAFFAPRCEETITAIREALAEQPAQQQEPVARSKAYDMIDRFLQNNLNSDEDYAQYSKALDSIYTSPPASKPLTLTNKQIDCAIAELGLNYFADAANNRAVLRELCKRAAHGIKEKNA